MNVGVSFEFVSAEEMRMVVLLLCKQALVIEKFARLRNGDDGRIFEEEAREAIAIAARIDAAADRHR
jgi:hypothetical protein